MDLLISNDLGEIEKVQQAFRDFAIGDNRITDQIVNQMGVVIDEVLSNIINHGYTDQLSHEIEVFIGINSGYLELIFKDDGISFNPLLVEQEALSNHEKETKIGGLGIQLMKRLVDDVEYNRIGTMNQLKIRKQLTH